jgi:hypothetical protein
MICVRDDANEVSYWKKIIYKISFFVNSIR